jgi:hypothetical protein
MMQEIPERLRRRCETRRYAHAGIGKLTDHFAQRGVFAPHCIHIAHSKLLERYD